MSAGAALTGGLVRALRAWPAVLVLYLAQLVPSALAAYGGASLTGSPVGLGLAEFLTSRPLDLNRLVEVFAALNAGPALGGGAAAVWPLVAGGALLAPLLYALVSGGVIERLRGGPGGFMVQSLAWFWPLARLWLLAGFVGAAWLALALGLAAVSPVAPLVMFGLWPLLGDAAFELARTAMVARGERRAWRGLGLGVWRLRRGLGPLLLYLVLLVPSAVVFVGHSVAVTGDGGLAALAVAQLWAVAGSLVKAWRLGAAVVLWEQSGALTTAPTPAASRVGAFGRR